MSIRRTWAEIVATMADVAECGDVAGHLAALREVLNGTIRDDDPIGGGFVPSQTARRLVILDLAARRGRVVNRDIRERFGVTSEAVRLDLAALVEMGALVRHGQWRHSWYELAGPEV